MLYTIKISIATVIQYIYKHMLTPSFLIRTGLLISDFGPWRHKERETQFLKAYANYTMLTPPQRVVHLVIFKISIHLCQLRSTCLNGRRPNYIFNGQNPTDIFSKSSDSQDHLFWAWRHLHSSPISCLGVYSDKLWLSYPLRTSVTAPNDYAPVLRDSNNSKPY